MDGRVISAGGVSLLVAAGMLVAGAVMGQFETAIPMAVLVEAFFGVLAFMISSGDSD